MMTSPAQRSFDPRAFTVLGAAISGFALPFTGLENHLHQMEPLTRVRHAWMAAHTSLGILCLVFVTWHIVLNRRPLLKYLRGLRIRGRLFRREALLAAAIVGLLFYVAVGHAFWIQG